MSPDLLTGYQEILQPTRESQYRKLFHRSVTQRPENMDLEIVYK